MWVGINGGSNNVEWWWVIVKVVCPVDCQCYPPSLFTISQERCIVCSALWDKFKKERLKGVEKTRIKGGEGR